MWRTTEEWASPAMREAVKSWVWRFLALHTWALACEVEETQLRREDGWTTQRECEAVPLLRFRVLRGMDRRTFVVGLPLPAGSATPSLELAVLMDAVRIQVEAEERSAL